MTKREQTLEILKILDLGAEGYGNVRRLVAIAGWDEIHLAAKKTLQAKGEGWGSDRVFGYFRSLVSRVSSGETVALRPNGLDGYREAKASQMKQAALDREAKGVRAPVYESREYHDPRCEPFYDGWQRELDYEDNQC